MKFNQPLNTKDATFIYEIFNLSAKRAVEIGEIMKAQKGFFEGLENAMPHFETVEEVAYASMMIGGLIENIDSNRK